MANETPEQRAEREQEERDRAWVAANTGYQSADEVPTQAEFEANAGDDTYSVQD